MASILGNSFPASLIKSILIPSLPEHGVLKTFRPNPSNPVWAPNSLDSPFSHKGILLLTLTAPKSPLLLSSSFSVHPSLKIGYPGHHKKFNKMNRINLFEMSASQTIFSLEAIGLWIGTYRFKGIHSESFSFHPEVVLTYPSHLDIFRSRVFHFLKIMITKSDYFF